MGRRLSGDADDEREWGESIGRRPSWNSSTVKAGIDRRETRPQAASRRPLAETPAMWSALLRCRRRWQSFVAHAALNQLIPDPSSPPLYPS
uniref:Uncharacterized protein n=1 Tax=Plectus sambesii TaxID=2011161 RepID=A0A914X747_9BILA